jgi:hypothetical protein
MAILPDGSGLHWLTWTPATACKASPDKHWSSAWPGAKNLFIMNMTAPIPPN